MTVIALSIVDKGVITFSGNSSFRKVGFRMTLSGPSDVFFINFLKLNLILISYSIFILLLAIKIYAGKFGWGEANITLICIKIGLTIMCDLKAQWKLSLNNFYVV